MPITIAIIDDDEAVRDSTKAVLECHGFAVHTYESAEAFLLHVGKRADCLLVDYNMPGISGLELIARLRERTNATPALLITGKGNSNISSLAKAFGVPYLTKPVPEEELLAHITTAIGDLGTRKEA